MFLNRNTQIIVGPPGTGKTNTLIQQVTELVQAGVDPSQIGYISFTRQAVREASSRVVTSTGQELELFKGFKTLHALVFWILGKDRKAIADMFDVDNISFLPKHLQGTVSKARTKMYAQLYNLHRVTGKPLETVWEQYCSPTSGTREDFYEWIYLYDGQKKAACKVDFTDLIKEFIDKGMRFPFQYLFIDEAQDFSPDQWQAVKQLARDSQQVVVAGDSDQSVFGWSGGQSTMLDELEGMRYVLSQSFRVPQLPYLLASRVLESLGRQPLYSPTPERGSVQNLFLHEVSGLPVDNGETWFFLCRNNFQCEAVSKLFYRNNIYFRPISSTKLTEDSHLRYVSRVQWYIEANRPNGELTERRRKKMEDCCSDVGAALDKGLPWQQAFDLWPVARVEYLASTMDEWDTPKVFVGTFHSSKGAEADNVVLFGDCTARIAGMIEAGDEEEHRALYVAMTRTRNRLYLVHPKGKRGIQWSRFHRLPEDLTNGLL